jgi:hypothetical protein
MKTRLLNNPAPKQPEPDTYPCLKRWVSEGFFNGETVLVNLDGSAIVLVSRSTSFPVGYIYPPGSCSDDCSRSWQRITEPTTIVFEP